jgi:DNA ligase-associated metallophosphoesterase
MLSTSLQTVSLQLLPEKVIYLPEYNWLLLADLHVGKAAHFRRQGIALSDGSLAADLTRLSELQQRLQPAAVVVLGDLFHATANAEWADFAAWLEAQPAPMVLVAGNHDRFFMKKMPATQLRLERGTLAAGRLRLSHAPEVAGENDGLNICGHLHPGLQLQGRAGMRLRLPCFWLRPQQLVLPAFGGLTGLSLIRPAKGDRVAVVAENQCIWAQGAD